MDIHTTYNDIHEKDVDADFLFLILSLLEQCCFAIRLIDIT